MTWRTIGIPDLLDHKKAFSVQFSDHHWNTRTLDNQTKIYHFNTRLVRYLDGYCIIIKETLNSLSNKLNRYKGLKSLKFSQFNSTFQNVIMEVVEKLNGKSGPTKCQLILKQDLFFTGFSLRLESRTNYLSIKRNLLEML